MKFSPAIIFFALLGTPLLADELPPLTDKPWLGTYVGFRDRGFDFSFNIKGKGQLFLMESKERTDASSYFGVDYILEEEVKEGKWVKRQMKQDGFSYTHDATVELEESIVTATYTGDTKVAIKHEFERGMVKIRAKVVEKKTENPVRFNVVVRIPDIWKNWDKSNSNPSEEWVEEKFANSKSVQDAQMRAIRVSDGKRVKYEFWEDVKLIDEGAVGPAGAKEVYIDGDKKFGGRRVTIKSGNPENAPLIAVNQGKLYSGLTVSWATPEASLANEDNFLVFQVK